MDTKQLVTFYEDKEKELSEIYGEDDVHPQVLDFERDVQKQARKLTVAKFIQMVRILPSV